MISYSLFSAHVIRFSDTKANTVNSSYFENNSQINNLDVASHSLVPPVYIDPSENN